MKAILLLLLLPIALAAEYSVEVTINAEVSPIQEPEPVRFFVSLGVGLAVASFITRFFDINIFDFKKSLLAILVSIVAIYSLLTLI